MNRPRWHAVGCEGRRRPWAGVLEEDDDGGIVVLAARSMEAAILAASAPALLAHLEAAAQVIAAIAPTWPGLAGVRKALLEIAHSGG